MKDIFTTLFGVVLAALQAWQTGAIATGDPILVTLSLLTAALGWLAKDPSAPQWYNKLWQKK